MYVLHVNDPRKQCEHSSKIHSRFPIRSLSTDILGPLLISDRGNLYILTIVDQFTHWVEAYAVPDFTAKTVAQKLVDEFISHYLTYSG